MKKLLVILVALVGFGISANAQTPYIYDVQTSTINRGGETLVQISVTIKGHKDNLGTCNQRVKVTPITRNILDLLFISPEYATVSYNGKNGEGVAYFTCTPKQNAETVIGKCGAYDFKVELINDGCK